jgi:predicted MFS family arabinose efflux permease
VTDDQEPNAPVLVAGLFVVSSAAAAYEIAPASVTPIIRDSLAIGPTTAGWLVSVMYATAVVASVPVGVAIDRTSVRAMVAAAALALLVAGAWGWAAARAEAYWWLIASRVLGGFAYVVVWNSGASVIGQAVQPGRRATAVGIFTASAPVGFAMGQFGAPLITDAFGWPAIFPTYAALAALGVTIFLFATAGGTLTVDSAVPTRSELHGLATNRGAWTLYVLCFLAFTLYLFLNSWLPSYLTDEIGVSVAVGGALTALFPLVGALSRVGSGLVSDRVFGGRRRPVVVLAFALSTPAVAAFVLTTWVPAIVALVVVAGLGVQLAIGLLYTYVPEVVEPEVRTTAIAALTSVGLLGAFLAPIGAGSVIGAAGYRPTFLIAGGVGVAGILLALRAPGRSD